MSGSESSENTSALIVAFLRDAGDITAYAIAHHSQKYTAATHTGDHILRRIYTYIHIAKCTEVFAHKTHYVYVLDIHIFHD